MKTPKRGTILSFRAIWSVCGILVHRTFAIFAHKSSFWASPDASPKTFGNTGFLLQKNTVL